ncbi:MAG: sugar transferase [Chloroflexi bacterium]|nr:sugar transferase [Chloroflexota bacterium]
MDATYQRLGASQPREAGEDSRPQVRLELKTQRRLLVTGLVVLDSLMLVASASVAYLVRFQIPLPLFRDVLPRLEYYLPMAGGMVLLWLGLFVWSGLYDEHNLLGGTREYALVFNACTTGTLLIVFGTFLVEAPVSRGLLVLTWLFTLLFVGSARFVFRRLIYRLRRQGYFLRPAVVVGANAEGVALARQLDIWAASGMRLVGFVDDTLPPGTMIHNGLSVLGTLDDLERLTRQEGVKELVVATAGVTRERLLDVVQTYGMSPEVDIHFSSGLFEILTTGVRVRERAYVPLISLNKVRLTGVDVLLKTTLDLAITLPGLIVISPLLALIAILIKLDSPGPVFHRRRVFGLYGREFDAFKFRTMYADWQQRVDSDEVRNQFVLGVKPKNDPRVTRLGRFLRQYSLDELPQLINVLKRDMSLVGPRMITKEEAAFYEQWKMNLLTIRPGITGLWQVSGRADVTYEEKVRVDMYYIRNYTIWLDLQILFQTIPAVLKREGAY